MNKRGVCPPPSPKEKDLFISLWWIVNFILQMSNVRCGTQEIEDSNSVICSIGNPFPAGKKVSGFSHRLWIYCFTFINMFIYLWYTNWFWNFALIWNSQFTRFYSNIAHNLNYLLYKISHSVNSIWISNTVVIELYVEST